MAERTTVRLPEALVAQAKRKALAEGRTLTSLIEDGLRRVVHDSDRPVPKRRALPPISRSGGGPVSGPDIPSWADIQALDDLGHAARVVHQT